MHSHSKTCFRRYGKGAAAGDVTVNDTMGKRKNEPLHLKDSFLHLKNLFYLKLAFDK